MNKQRSDTLPLQRSSPFPKQHIQRRLPDRIGGRQTGHVTGQLDRAEDGRYLEDLLGPFAPADEREESA